MNATDDTHRLLTQIRDLQRESLDEYRRVTSRSLQLQEQAVERQEQVSALYKRALVAGALVILPLLGLLVYVVRLIL